MTEDGYWAARELAARPPDCPSRAARRATSADEAAAALAELGGPVVLKALGVLHKSDAGGVALGLATAAEVAGRLRAMDARLRARGYCVERMADAPRRRRADRRRPPRPALRSGRDARARRRVRRGAARRRLRARPGRRGGGARDARPPRRRVRCCAARAGAPPVDVDAVAAAVAALTALAAAHPEIAELEVNPLLAGPAGCVALDARLVLATPTPEEG